MQKIGWRVAFLAGLAWTVASAHAEPYWIAWEGNDLPENEGWSRNWGNWEGQYEGPGAIRTLQDGIMTYDSLYDDGVADFSLMRRPGQVDPDVDELFVMEWRLKVETVIGSRDPGIFLSSDDAWVLGLTYAWDRIYSGFESDVVIPFTPGVFHDYQVVSHDMRAYDLYIDGELARHGAFWAAISPSELAWGDFVQGAASLHHWDYFRFGVAPEPATLCPVLILGLWMVRKRQ